MNILTAGDGKNHNFGKLVGDNLELELAPAAFIVDGKQYIGNNETRYREAGYWRIEYVSKPTEIESGYHYEAGYYMLPYSIDENGQTIYRIYQNWVKVSDLPENAIVTSTITDWSYYCYNGARLETARNLDTSGGVIFDRMFYKASENENSGVTIIELSCRKARSMLYTFYQFDTLTHLTLHLPSMETAEETGVGSINSMNMNSAFRYASKLEHLKITGRLVVTTDDLNFAYCPLSRDSLVSILNALYSDGNDHKILLGSANISLLTEDEIADAKDNKKITFE